MGTQMTKPPRDPKASLCRPSSRLPGFYRRSRDERRSLVEHLTGLPRGATEVYDHGGIGPDQADSIIENTLGVYALPIAVAGLGIGYLVDRVLPFL